MVASTRTVSAGRWPGPKSGNGSNQPITHAISSRLLLFNAALLVQQHQMGMRANIGTVRRVLPKIVVRTAPK